MPLVALVDWPPYGSSPTSGSHYSGNTHRWKHVLGTFLQSRNRSQTCSALTHQWLKWCRIHLQCRRPGFDPWFRKIPWRRKWLLFPVFLPGEFHRQRILGGYIPWGHKELDTTEQLTLSILFHMTWNYFIRLLTSISLSIQM